MYLQFTSRQMENMSPALTRLSSRSDHHQLSFNPLRSIELVLGGQEEQDMSEKRKGINNSKKALAPKQREELVRTLKARFEKKMSRHKGLEWAGVQAKLEANPEKLWSLDEMERSGGEPDVVGHNKKTGKYTFYDCSAESP